MASDDKNSRSDPTSAQAQSGADQPKNPYGGGRAPACSFRHTQFMRSGGQRAPRTQIIAIGAAGSIDGSLLEKTFASCIAVATADT